MHFCLRLLLFWNFHQHDFAFIFQLNLSHNKIPFVTRKMFPESRWVPYKLTHIDLSHNVMPVLTRFSFNPTFFDSTKKFTFLIKTRFFIFHILLDFSTRFKHFFSEYFTFWKKNLIDIFPSIPERFWPARSTSLTSTLASTCWPT